MNSTILKIAIPAIVGQILFMMMETINLIYVGHLGDTSKVAGVGLGNMYINICCQSIINGVNIAIATLVS